MPSVRIIVYGLVQGVGYRAYVRHVAMDLGVSGEVWNRPDGAVELHASSTTQDDLDRLCLLLQVGPGQPSAIESEPSDRPQSYEDFRIVRKDIDS